MTFNPAAAMTIKSLVEQAGVPIPARVIEFGNQRYTAQIIEEARDTRDFYLKVGFSEYEAWDVNERMHAKVKDLNKLFSGESEYCLSMWWEPVGLVTNIGTSEHIFNQAAVFENAHDACANGGYMYHQLPFTPWLNHGFFNYNPIFFRDLAAANDYEIVMLDILDREGNTVPIDDEDLFLEKNPVKLMANVQAAARNLFVNIVYRKVNSEPFKYPFQGKYKKDIEAQELKERYVQKDSPNEVPTSVLSHDVPVR